MNIGFTPVNQVRLTNVAYVRLQKKGKRFEIACYRNKVLNWRNKIETDIGEVLQVDTVFTHVSKGLLASGKDLMEAFGTSDQRLVCQEILDKGELQVSEQERGALYESVFRDVASIVADKTVNPENNRPYTVSMIQNAMKQIQYAVNVSKNSKSQALDVIRKLRDVMPIVRANMLLRVICLQEEVDPIRSEVVASGAVVVSTDAAANSAPNVNRFIELRIDPELFRKIEEIVSEKTGGVGRVEVVQLRVANSQPSANTATNSSSSAAAVSATCQEEVNNKKTGEGSVAEASLSSGGGSGGAKGEKGSKGKSSTSALSRGNKSKERASHMAQELALLAGEEEVDDDEKEYDMLRELEEEGEDLEAIGIVKNSNKKKNKQKKQIAAALEISDDEEEGDNHSGGEEVHLAVPITATAIADMGTEGTHGGGGGVVVQGVEDAHSDERKTAHVNKKGKKSKRLEKEELKEREKKALALKQRISAQNSSQSVPMAVECAAKGETSSSTGASSSTATTAAASAVPVGSDSSEPSEAAAVMVPEVHVSVVSGAKAQSCNTCGGQFFDVKDYRNHFRSEWHRHNLSRKLKNKPLVKSEEEFLSLTLEELDL